MSTATAEGTDRCPQHVRVAVIGAGFAGIGAGIRLRQAGRTDFVILERAGAVGGTWRDNTYPGCTCDVPSHLYSFSFAPNPDWSHSFSRQPEIWAYLDAVTDRYALRPYIRFGTELAGARWDESQARWQLRTSRGDMTADVVIAAAGPLSTPSLPDIPGLDTFPGDVFHSARWNHEANLAGKRVAVIGTGASAIQIVPAHPAGGGPADPVPAHPGLGHAAPGPADHRGREAAVPAGPADRADGAARPARQPGDAGRGVRQAARAAPRRPSGSPCATWPGPCRTRSCGPG